MKKTWVIVFSLILFWSLSYPSFVEAVGEPYTIDQAPLDVPEFDDYTVTKVSSLSELSTALNSSTSKVSIELQNDMTITSSIIINGDKELNLNGHTLNAGTNGYLSIDGNSTTNQFKLFNGKIIGGPVTQSPGSRDTQNSAFLNVSYQKNINVVFEDIAYKSNDNGGNFFVGLATNVFSLGTVTVETYAQNIRAGNITFLGDFNGYSFGNGLPNDRGNASGGVNLTFDGYNNSYINKTNGGPTSMSQSVGDRRIYIGKNSHVVLNNTNNANNNRGYLAYANNIGNFSIINVDGSLEATSVGTSLRTTASSRNNGMPYNNQAGTFNGQANIYVNQGAKFKVSSTNETATYGTLFTYNTNLYVYKPDVLDMRYFGTGNFFYSYPNSPQSNLYLYNQSIGVWLKNDKGIGNPTRIWQNVDWMNLLNFYATTNGTGATDVSSSDPTLTPDTFKIDDYSRISNNVELPMIVLDPTFINESDQAFLNNGDTTFSGTTDYYLPGNVKLDKAASNATVTLNLNGKTYTTQTTDDGTWRFADLDLSTVKGGTIGTVDLVDTDKRLATQIKFTVKDTIAPKATPKLIKADLGSTTKLNNPLDGISTYSDETTTNDKMTVEFVNSDAERTKMVNELGVHDIGINVIDEAGNKTLVSTKVVVHPKGENITDGYVFGKDYNIDYLTWVNASDSQKREFVLSKDYGNTKGYAISGNAITDVSTDPSNMLITIPSNNWEPNKTYDIPVKVNSYTKIIKVTLVPSTVKMTIKQVYKGTDTPIYSDLETKSLVKNDAYEETIGDNIEEVLNKLISDKKIVLNYEGYNPVIVSDYKIYQHDKEMTKSDTVPNDDFSIIYEYEGQLKFKDIAEKLDFGSVTISAEDTETPLSDSSDKSLSIINTIQDSTWKLKASLPSGITQVNGKKSPFIGNVIYKDILGDTLRIGQSATIIETQKDNQLFSHIQLKNKDTGIFLKQEAGNLKGSYSGELLWTLEDSP